MASFSPDYSLSGDNPQKAALQELLQKFGTQGGAQPAQATTPTDPTAATGAPEQAGRPTDPRVRLLVMQLKADPTYAVMEDKEIQDIAEDIIAKGGHPMTDQEVVPAGGQQ